MAFLSGLKGPSIYSTPSPPYTNLMIELLPYIEQPNLQKQFDTTNPTSDANGANTGLTSDDSTTVAAQVIDNFRCPSTTLPPQNNVNGFIFGTNDYAGNGGTRVYHPATDSRKPDAAARRINDGLFNLCETNNPGVAAKEVSDGMSKTFMFGERTHVDAQFDRLYPKYPLAGWCGWAWTGVVSSVGDNLGHSAVPINYMIPPNNFQPNSGFATNYVNDRLSAWGSNHSSGANFCFADGSVNYYEDRMDLTVLQALSTIRGGETVTLP